LKGLEKLKGDDEIVKSLHSLLFSSVSKKLEGKKNIRMFNGFADEKTKIEKLSKVAENKKKWTVQLLKDVLGLFGMEKTGTRTELVEKLMDYLMSPTAIKDESSGTAPKRKTTKAASTNAVATKGTKRKATNDGNAPKKARAPSAYILFSVGARIEVKKTNPDATFAEIGALVGKKWSSIDEDEKKVKMMRKQYQQSAQNPNLETFINQKWTDLAAEKAAAMKVKEDIAGEADDEDDDKDDDLFGNGEIYGGKDAEKEKDDEEVKDDDEEKKSENDEDEVVEEDPEEQKDVEEQEEKAEPDEDED
jgi:HMG (high mobility group) box